MRETLAKLISNILNPFLIGVAVLVLVAFETTATTADAFKWSAIALALSVLPVFIVTICMVRLKMLDGLFTNPRRQRNLLYLLASVLAALGCGLLWYLDAPRLISVTFTAGLAAIVIFMIINYFWKISLHTAFISASVAVVIIVYGAAAAWASVLVPPVAWARIKLKQHTLAQVITGGFLAAAIVVGVFWGCGEVG
jgi:membrane-associated phospholipid phosphatase